MAQRISISGSDLDYFRGIVRDGLNGSFGNLSEVAVAVEDSGKVTFSVNGYTSAAIGTTTYRGDSDTTGANPYANIDAAEGDSEGDQPVRKNKERIATLERDVAYLQKVVQLAESKLGVQLKP